MNRPCKISVIIPVYNAESWIVSCLESILTHQDLYDIEAICIDDGSTDQSSEILHNLAENDSRIQIMTQKNAGLSATRNVGITLATGNYILFLDSDDLIAENTLSLLYSEAEKKDLDILCFDAEMVFENKLLEKKYKRYSSYYIKKGKYDCISTGNEFFTTIVENDDFAAPAWLNLIKRSFLQTSGIKFHAGILHEDELFTPEIMLKAKRVCHIKKKVYFYRIRECSIMSRPRSIANVRGYLTAAWRLAKYFEIYQSDSKTFAALGQRIDWLMAESVYCFRKLTGEEQRKIDTLSENEQQFFQISCLKKGLYPRNFEKKMSTQVLSWFIKYHSPVDAINILWSVYRKHEEELAKKLFSADSLKTRKKKIETIGIFYGRYTQGGVERGISFQMPMFLKMGYKVILLTEEYNPEQEYSMPCEVKREILPKNYGQERGKVFIEKIKENEIDLLLYQDSSSGNVLFDIILVKSQGIPVVIFRHELSTFPLTYLSNRINSLNHIYKLADQLLVLTTMDEQYYQLMGVNAKYLPNMNNIVPLNENTYSGNEGIILWVGRLETNPKNYLDAVAIMRKVVENHPDAQMVMLGKESDSHAAERLARAIREGNLQDNIRWISHTPDMESWYEKAKIHLVTSSYESFSRVIIESKTYGIPLVTYSMPYLELLKDGKGYVAVPQNGIAEAAEAISRLLHDNTLCERLSKEAKESVQPFMCFDHPQAWTEIFHEILEPTTKASVPDLKINREDMKILLETFGFHYGKGLEKYKKEEARRQYGRRFRTYAWRMSRLLFAALVGRKSGNFAKWSLRSLHLGGKKKYFCQITYNNR